MKINLLLFLLALVSNSNSFGQRQLEKITLSPEGLEMMVPAELNKRDTIDNFKVLKNIPGTVQIRYNLASDSVTDNDIPQYADRLIGRLRASVPGFKYIDDGIHLQDGKNIGYIKYRHKQQGRKYFEYLFYITVNDQLLSFNFSSSWKDRERWEPIVDAIANSLRLIPAE